MSYTLNDIEKEMRRVVERAQGELRSPGPIGFEMYNDAYGIHFEMILDNLVVGKTISSIEELRDALKDYAALAAKCQLTNGRKWEGFYHQKIGYLEQEFRQQKAPSPKRFVPLSAGKPFTSLLNKYPTQDFGGGNGHAASDSHMDSGYYLADNISFLKKLQKKISSSSQREDTPPYFPNPILTALDIMLKGKPDYERIAQETGINKKTVEAFFDGEAELHPRQIEDVVIALGYDGTQALIDGAKKKSSWFQRNMMKAGNTDLFAR